MRFSRQPCHAQADLRANLTLSPAQYNCLIQYHTETTMPQIRHEEKSLHVALKPDCLRRLGRMDRWLSHTSEFTLSCFSSFQPKTKKNTVPSKRVQRFSNNKPLSLMRRRRLFFFFIFSSGDNEEEKENKRRRGCPKDGGQYMYLRYFFVYIMSFL